jgi:hypothetical protein
MGQRRILKKYVPAYILFSQAQGFTYSAQCTNILWSNRHQTNNPNYRSGDNDFALIRLDRNIPLTPLKIARGGLQQGTKVYPVVVDQMGGFNARITKLECQIETSNCEIWRAPIIQLSGDFG